MSLFRIPYHLTKPFPYHEKIAFFRKVVYVFLLFNAITLLPIAGDIFGYYGIVGSAGWQTGVPWYKLGSKAFLNVLSHPLNANHPWIAYSFVFGQIFFLILGLWKKLPRFSAIAIYVLSVNLFSKGYLVFTGGEALLGIVLFYLIFIGDKRTGKEGENLLNDVLNNTFYWILLIQVCVMYFCSGIWKLLDPFWIDGTALMYISKVSGFSGEFMRGLFSENLWVSKMATYLTLGYQLTFPILVWVKQIKIPFLILGIVFHITIAFWMGIFSFGVIMIIVYLLFLDGHQIEALRRFPKRLIKGKAERNA